METLLLNDLAYVEERYNAIEAERQRRQGQRRSSHQAPRAGDHLEHNATATSGDDVAGGALARVCALTTVWSPSPTEKVAIVMEDMLSNLMAQIQRTLERRGEDPPPSPTKDSTKRAFTNASDISAPQSLQELPASSQLGLAVFFRVCASLRSTMSGTGNARLLAMVAAKIPSMLAKLPLMPLAPGVVNTSCPIGGEKNAENTLSVFEELLGIFGPLLESNDQAANDKIRYSLSDAERANVLMAYVAVSLKWGRLRDLVEVMNLLITHSKTLTPQHMELLAPVLSELVQAEAVVPARQLLPEESSPTGYLVSFGKGDHGKLGHGQCTHASCSDTNCTENKNVPTVIASTREIKFVKVDSLSTHSIAITTKGEVLAWGNGDKYRLGHGTTNKEYAPRTIDSLNLKGKVSDVACGLGHTLALMVNGEIYAWGNGSNGRLGLGDSNDRSNPTKVTIVSTMEGPTRTASAAPPQATSTSSVFRHVVCGASHSLAVTADGRVFAWGKNNQGQCGLGHTNDQLTAIEIRHFRDELNELIVCAAGGWEHTLFCSSSGRVYSCGCGYKDSRRTGIPPVLGHGDCEKRLKPTVLQCFIDANEEMARVSCGWDHSLAVSSQGALFTWGSGTNGKLGHGDEENCEVPTLVRSLVGKVVKDAKAGCEHTIALTDNHELWTFGQGDSGRLGLGDTATRKVPTMVEFFVHSGLRPVAIAVGDKYNLVLADDISCQATLKSPGKPTLLSSGIVGDLSTGRARRSHLQSTKLPESLHLRPLDQLLLPREEIKQNVGTDAEGTGSSVVYPHDHDQLLKTIAVNLARLSTDYMSTLWNREETDVKMLPYGVDTSPLTLERVLKVIRICQDCLSHSPPSSTSDAMLEVIVVCLRILTVNISQWTLKASASHCTESSLLKQVGEAGDELARTEVPRSQQVVDSDRAVQLQSLVQEEAAHVLQVGFTLFYPTTAVRIGLLWDLDISERSSSHQLSLRVVALASKMCDDSIAHDIVLHDFVQSATHECYTNSSDEMGDTTSFTAAASIGGSKPVHRFMTALFHACAHEANQQVDEPVTEGKEALVIRLRLLTVLQSHWFAISAYSISESNADGVKKGTRSLSSPSICECCVKGLSKYLCVVFDEAVTTLKKVCQVTSQSEEATTLGRSFLETVVLQAVQAASALMSSLQSKSSTVELSGGSRITLTMAKTLQTGARCMVEILDEISRKLSSAAMTRSSLDGNHETTSSKNWVDMLGNACALLCGQISSCYVGSLGTCGTIQRSRPMSDHPSEMMQQEDNIPEATLDPDRPSVGYFRDGLCLITELLRQLHSPSMKIILLLKLSHTIQHVFSTADSLQNACMLEGFDLTQAIVDLCGQLTDAATAEDVPTRARVAALGTWLWVLHSSLIAPTQLSQLICESGVVPLAAEILLLKSSQAVVDEVPCRTVHQISASQRSQPSLRQRPVEEMIGTLEPSQVLFLVTFEVFSAATKQLCSTFVTPPNFLHPLLALIQTDIQRSTTASLRQGQPITPPRQRQTLSKKSAALSTVEAIKALFGYVCVLLQGCLDAQERRSDAVSPFISPSSTNTLQPRAAFLLASPLSISTSRSHIVRTLRLPDAASPLTVSTTDGLVKAMSLWFFADMPSSSATPHGSVVVLAAMGEGTDRLQESAASAGSNIALELGTDDGLCAIVFLFSDNGKLCIGCTLSNDIKTSSSSTTSPQPVWTTWVVDGPIESGRWIHVSVSCSAEDPRVDIYVDGRRQLCQHMESRSSDEDLTWNFGKITSHVQLVTGGTIDDSLMVATRISAILDKLAPPLPVPTSGSSVEVLIDDVWVFRDVIDETLAQRLYRHGPTLLQIKRDHDDDQKTLAVLQLLKQILILLPVGEANVDPSQPAEGCDRETVAAQLQANLFQLIRDAHSDSSFQIALYAAELLKHVVPVASKPAGAVVEALLECTSNRVESTTLDLREEVSRLYAFSARAGVQSAAISTSLVTIQTLLRQRDILKAPRTSGDITRFKHVLASSLVDHIQILSGLPAWEPHCTHLLKETAIQMNDAMRSPTGSESSPVKPIAAVAMVAGYCETFMNNQVVALGSAITAKDTNQLPAPWTTTHRSTLLLTSTSYFCVAWRFGCDFKSDIWNLGGRQDVSTSSKSLLSHDLAVLDRVRLQTYALRSLVGPLRYSSKVRHRIHSDADAMELLLRAAVVRSIDIVKRRLGPDEKLARKLFSVQFLMSICTHARTRSPATSRLLIEENLEVLASELLAKLESQHRNALQNVTSNLRPHYWRDPKSIWTPLEALSGDVEIQGFSIRATQHFPTVRMGRVAITASSGLWYYEVHVLTDGLMQIGYIDTEFVADAVLGQGVGDHTNSWAFDGYRRRKWNVSSSDYGECWQPGDVVGVLLDTDRMELSYFLNGRFLGIAFPSLPLSPTSLLFPAISLNADQRVRFDFGEKLKVIDSAKGHETVGSLRLPRLSSPLDTQRLRPVAAAIEETTDADVDSDYGLDPDSDTDHGDEQNPAAHGSYSPLETPTTPPSPSSFTIYHPGQVDEGNLYRLPESLNNDKHDSKRGDSEDNYLDDTDVRGEHARKSELVDGLVSLGFPHSWAVRCADETSFTLSDTGAITWILEQMESEAVSSMNTIQNGKGSANEEISDDLGSDSQSALVPRRAHDDLALSVNPRSVGPDGQRSWQLTLSLSRDGRPHSEQHIRSRVPLSSPQKQVESKPTSHTGTRQLDANPFFLAELESDDTDGNDQAQESDAHVWNATAAHEFYKSTYSGSLRQQFARLDLSTNAEVARSKDDAPRLQPTGGNGHEEDVLPACLIAHSILSLAYVRLITETVVFDNRSETAVTYPIVVQWTSAEPPGLFAFLRMQLQLDPKEIPVSCSRGAYPSDEHKIQIAFTRMLKFELENAHSTASPSLPLVQSVVMEIRTRVADALRDCKRVKAAAGSTDKVLVYAMDARWVLWLVSTLRAALGEAIPLSAAMHRVAIEAILEPAFVSNLINLTNAATASTVAWRNAAFSIFQQMFSMDVSTQTSPHPTAEAATIFPIHFVVELLARLTRKDQSRRIAFGEPVATLWETVLTHLPSTQSVHPSEISAQALTNEMALRVEQVASTNVTISWECQEPIKPAISEEENTCESALVDNSILTLSIIPQSAITASAQYPARSGSTLASGVPHFIPSKGSLILRQLAPDTVYTIRITKSTSPLPPTEAHEQVTSTTTITQAVHVQTPLEPVFELDGDAAGTNLVLSRRNRTVKNQVNKKWHTVRATIGFREGVHHWLVRIDTCVSKNIFIGISTADASLENYVGSDAFGYGFLANKAVWHNKTKLSAYGEIFKQGDVLQVSLDCTARTLSYSRNGEFLGVAASNLHVATATSSSGTAPGGTVGCKWYPTFSLYNKDDQLTLIVPQQSNGASSSRPQSQHASILTLIYSARMLLTFADHMRRSREDCAPPYVGQSPVYEKAIAVWLKWKQGQICWREVGIGEVREIDATQDAVADTFGLAPGDTVFMSRGHCVVLGVHNHELWYEIVDALEPSASGKISSLGSWSLSVCRDMVNSPDKYPVHRARRNSRDMDVAVASTSTEELAVHSTPQLARDKSNPQEMMVFSETVFSQSQLQFGETGQLDTLLVSLVDAIVAHRGLSSAYHLSYAALSSAIVLHDVVDTLRPVTADDSVLCQDVLLMRLLVLYYMNQHVYRVTRLFLSQTPSPLWENSVCTAVAAATNESESDSDKIQRDSIVAAARLAANVCFPRPSLSVPSYANEGTVAIDVSSRDFQTLLRTHLFETQREQLITESLRRSATPTLVGTVSDSKSAELGGGDDALPGEPKDMLRLKVRLPSEGTAKPFWQQSSHPACAKSDRCWMLPTREERSTSIFAQVSTQLHRVDPIECRRQFATPSDGLPVYQTFQLCYVDTASSPTKDDAITDAVTPTDYTCQYLKFWDDLFIEIQSPRFPLFIPPTKVDSNLQTQHLELDVNAYLLLPEFAVRCGVDTDEAVAWFFQLGQLLGMVWRAQTIVPLQFVSLTFWRDLLYVADLTMDSTVDRFLAARSLAVRTIREGLCSIVPFECLQLSTPQSIRTRVSDVDMVHIDRLQLHAIYDRNAIHHEAFWTVARGFSSLERQALIRFLSGKPSYSPGLLKRIGDDPMEQWKQQVAAVLPTTKFTPPVPPRFQLELVDALVDAQDHPDACFPVVHNVDAHCTRLHLPVYSSATALRQKLLLAMTSLPAL